MPATTATTATTASASASASAAASAHAASAAAAYAAAAATAATATAAAAAAAAAVVNATTTDAIAAATTVSIAAAAAAAAATTDAAAAATAAITASTTAVAAAAAAVTASTAITIYVKTMAGDIFPIVVPIEPTRYDLYSLVYNALPLDIRPITIHNIVLSYSDIDEEEPDADYTINYDKIPIELIDGELFYIVISPPMTLDVPADGYAHEWTWNGVTYLVTSDKFVWEKGTGYEVGKWVGMIDLKRNIIDTTFPEPVYVD